MKKPVRLKLLQKVITALKWVDDIESGEMIQEPGYTSSYLGDFGDGSDSISVSELNVLCTIVNIILVLSHYKIRVSWGAGELRPTSDDKRIYHLDEELENDIKLYLMVEIGIRI